MRRSGSAAMVERSYAWESGATRSENRAERTEVPLDPFDRTEDVVDVVEPVVHAGNLGPVVEIPNQNRGAAVTASRRVVGAVDAEQIFPGVPVPERYRYTSS